MAAYKYLSDALPKALKAIDWQQKDLADKTGLPASQINRYCRGVGHPPTESIGKVLAALPEEQRGPVAVAYLQDCLPADYRAAVDIQPAGTRVRESASYTLLPGLDADLDTWLRHYARLGMQHVEVRNMLRSYLEALRLVPAADEPGTGSSPQGH